MENNNNEDRKKPQKLKNVTIQGDTSFIKPDSHYENVTIYTGNFIPSGTVFGTNNVVPEGATVFGSNNLVGNPKEIYMGQMSKLAMETQNFEIIKLFLEFQNEHKKENPNKKVMERLLEGVKNMAAINGATSLLEKVNEFSHYFL